MQWSSRQMRTADRTFFRDTLEFPSVDAGGGWLIFALPPAELAAHPAEENGRHELYLMCEDVNATVAELSARGDESGCISPSTRRRWLNRRRDLRAVVAWLLGQAVAQLHDDAATPSVWRMEAGREPAEQPRIENPDECQRILGLATDEGQLLAEVLSLVAVVLGRCVFAEGFSGYKAEQSPGDAFFP